MTRRISQAVSVLLDKCWIMHECRVDGQNVFYSAVPNMSLKMTNSNSTAFTLKCSVREATSKAKYSWLAYVWKINICCTCAFLAFLLSFKTAISCWNMFISNECYSRLSHTRGSLRECVEVRTSDVSLPFLLKTPASRLIWSDWIYKTRLICWPFKLGIGDVSEYDNFFQSIVITWKFSFLRYITHL